MLKEKLKADMIGALKSGDSARRSLLGMVIASIKNKELEKRGKLIKTITNAAELEVACQLTEQETIDVVASEVKRRRDSITEFEKGGRPELAESEKAEAEVLMTYLPEQLSDEALMAIIQKAIASTGAMTAKDMGKVMSAVKEETKGAADGQRVSTMVKEILK
ncbi:MAG: GatB/YqeY domain-containing protein [Candidatus Pacebacteria bacterium]|nr:GatB/YqeY domain-containing protein [Candidatus Paceibacterota bacterium]